MSNAEVVAVCRDDEHRFSKGVVKEIVLLTGLRNPCVQIDAFRPGLLRRVLTRAPDGGVVRRAGIMGIVLQGGRVCPGDVVEVVASSGPHVPLERV